MEGLKYEAVNCAIQTLPLFNMCYMHFRMNVKKG